MKNIHQKNAMDLIFNAMSLINSLTFNNFDTT